jgi:hypothetical protein
MAEAEVSWTLYCSGVTHPYVSRSVYIKAIFHKAEVCLCLAELLFIDVTNLKFSEMELSETRAPKSLCLH